MKTRRSTPPIARALGALVVALACVAFGIQTAIGATAEQLGKTKDAPNPNCPERTPPPGQQQTAEDLCQVTGQVTGFQKSADGEKGLFKVPEDGQIVAWSVDLADPTKAERRTFGEASETNQYGKAPTAGISIIRRKEGSVYKLMSSSPLLNVRGFYGEMPVFTLAQPLSVSSGDVVALTTATWLPAFSNRNQTEDDAWVASRKKEDCKVPKSVPPEDRIEYFFAHTAPHRKAGSERPYECRYDKARILYWAYFVPDN